MSTLAELRVGDAATVVRVDGSDEISMRLSEMGLVPGTSLSVAGTAWFGDPLEVEIRGYRLSVRKSEAARVIVEPIPVAG